MKIKPNWTKSWVFIFRYIIKLKEVGFAVRATSALRRRVNWLGYTWPASFKLTSASSRLMVLPDIPNVLHKLRKWRGFSRCRLSGDFGVRIQNVRHGCKSDVTAWNN